MRHLVGNQNRGTRLAASTLCLFISIHLQGSIITDSFNDGNDEGWTHYDPLAPFGAPAAFSFPDKAYRIQAPASPDATSLGPARAGSLRFDASQARFDVQGHVVDWSANVNQSFGLMAHASSIGRNSTDGYLFTYSTAGSLNILRLDNDVPTVLASVPFVLDPAKDYRFTFDGDFGIYQGVLYDASQGAASLASLTAIDTTYPSGVPGFYLFNNDGAGGVDATFDSFTAAVPAPEPSTWGLLAAGAIAFGLAFRRKATHSLEQQPKNSVPPSPLKH